MAKVHKPRSGSLAYMPRKRSKSERPRIRSWRDNGESKVLGFAGYKAGVTHVLAVDENKTSPTSGLEVSMPVTVVEAPPLKVVGFRVYGKRYGGLGTVSEVGLHSKGEADKKIEDLKKNTGEISDVRLIAETQPTQLSMPKKKPDVMEIGLGGGVEDKIEYASQVLGKEIPVDEFVSENKFVDVSSVTKGKGTQGVVKRYGIGLQSRKSTKKRRHVGSGGSWKPAHKLWCEPMPGQTGYHSRMEYNKFVLKVGENPEEVNPSGGFLRYGPVKNRYLLLKGSVPGPTKRLICFSHPRRKPAHDLSYNVTYVSRESKQGL